MSGNISKTAGAGLQEECTKKYPNGILIGSIAVTGGHKLKCKHVFHGALQTYETGKRSLQV